MVIFNATAILVQLIKLAVFFATLGLPAVHGTTVELWRDTPVAVVHEIERPHSNPRRRGH